MDNIKKEFIGALPIIALGIIATIPGEDFLSVGYILKSAIALTLLILALIAYVKKKQIK